MTSVLVGVDRVGQRQLKHRGDAQDDIDHIALSNIEEEFNAARQLCGNQDLPLLIIPADQTILSQDARQYIKEHLNDWPHVSIVSKSTAQRLLISFLLYVKGREKLRFCDSELDARDWLLENAYPRERISVGLRSA